MKDKVLAIIVTRNNSALLQNFINSLEAKSAGFPYHLIIADNTSTDPKHLKLLDKLSSKYEVMTCENDRVEGTFDSVSAKFVEDYKYFFFMHDDTLIHKDDWLKVYVDRINSGFCEKDISNTDIGRYPIGRVAGCHQPYRNFTSCRGIELYSLFLKEALSIYEKELIIYKYGDQDRSLWTQECLKANGGIWNVKKFKEIEDTELYNKLCEKLNQQLRYPDEGVAPKDKYPPNKCWNKLFLLSEFFNSAMPLIKEFRTVGLSGEGFLEQIDKFDLPWGNDYIAHLGTPHMRKWLGVKFSTTGEELTKKLYANDFTFLTKCNKLITDYFK